MKRFVSLIVAVLIATTHVFAQKVDYTTYNVVAKTKDVTVVMKDNNWLMIVGSLKKPKLEFILGNSKEQAAGRFDRLLEMCNAERYTKEERPVYFCGVMLQMTATGSGEGEKYIFRTKNPKTKFNLLRSECDKIKESILAMNVIE